MELKKCINERVINKLNKEGRIVNVDQYIEVDFDGEIKRFNHDCFKNGFLTFVNSELQEEVNLEVNKEDRLKEIAKIKSENADKIAENRARVERLKQLRELDRQQQIAYKRILVKKPTKKNDVSKERHPLVEDAKKYKLPMFFTLSLDKENKIVSECENNDSLDNNVKCELLKFTFPKISKCKSWSDYEFHLVKDGDIYINFIGTNIVGIGVFTNVIKENNDICGSSEVKYYPFKNKINVGELGYLNIKNNYEHFKYGLIKASKKKVNDNEDNEENTETKNNNNKITFVIREKCKLSELPKDLVSPMLNYILFKNPDLTDVISPLLDKTCY